MKFRRYIPLLLVAVAAIIGCRKENQTAVAPATTENASAAKTEESPNGTTEEFVIDVRSQDEWDSGHLDQAILIPHTEITERIAEVTEDKSAKIVLY
jgi:predicted sulfurtransferase